MATRTGGDAGSLAAALTAALTLSGFPETAGFFGPVLFLLVSVLFGFFVAEAAVFAEVFFFDEASFFAEDSFFLEDSFFVEDLVFAPAALPDLSFAISDLSCFIFFFRSFIVFSFFVMPHPPLPLHADRNIGTTGPARWYEC